MVLSLILCLLDEQQQQGRVITGDELQKLINGEKYENLTNNEQLEQNEEQEQQKPKYRGVQFFGGSLAHFISKPQNNQNSDSNSEVEFFFDGSARNSAEIFAKISEQPSKLVSIIGNDSLGQVLKDNLQQIGVNCLNLDIDNKIKTSTLIEMELNVKDIKKELNITEEENDQKQKFQTVQYNFDTLHNLSYKFLYPKFWQLNQSEFIYTDMNVNSNAIKALINNFANKLVLHMNDVNNVQKYQKIIQDINTDFVASQKGKKNKEQIENMLNYKKVNTMAMDIEEFITLLETSKQSIGKQQYFADIIDQISQINATKLLIQNFIPLKQKKLPYYEYLLQQNDTVKQLFELSLKLLNTDNLILFINPIQTIYADRSGLVAFSEHSCIQSCIKNSFGNQEAFITGYIAGIYQYDYQNIESILEMAGYTQISSLKSYQTINKNLSNKLLNNYKQKYYISYKELCTNQKPEILEQKSEL